MHLHSVMMIFLKLQRMRARLQRETNIIVCVCVCGSLKNYGCCNLGVAEQTCVRCVSTGAWMKLEAKRSDVRRMNKCAYEVNRDISSGDNLDG